LITSVLTSKFPGIIESDKPGDAMPGFSDMRAPPAFHFK